MVRFAELVAPLAEHMHDVKKEIGTDYNTSTCAYTCRAQRLLKFAVHNRNDQDNQHRNNRNSYNPICSHPIISLAQP